MELTKLLLSWTSYMNDASMIKRDNRNSLFFCFTGGLKLDFHFP